MLLCSNVAASLENRRKEKREMGRQGVKAGGRGLESWRIKGSGDQARHKGLC